MDHFGEALRLFRVFHDLSQTDLAERLKISKSFLSEIESGKKDPTLNLLSRYAEEFGVSLSSLLFFAETITSADGETVSSRIAPKVLKLLNWVSAAKDSEGPPFKKPVRSQPSPVRKKRFGT